MVIISNSKDNKTVNHLSAVGRRKEATARVYLQEGSGNIVVNKKLAENYFFMDKFLIDLVKKPLKLFNKENDYDLNIIVRGGGFSAQAEAALLGVSRILLKISPEDYKFTLRQNKCLTRDFRSKERRKPGLLKARKRYPFVKR